MQDNLHLQLVYSGLYDLGDVHNFEVVAFAPGAAHQDERLERFANLSGLNDAVYVPEHVVHELLGAYELEVANL